MVGPREQRGGQKGGEIATSRDSRIHADLQELARLRYKAQGFSFLPRQPIHSLLTGRHASRLRGRGLNFEEIRRYLPGDDIRQINWKVTARTQKPHSSVFTEERDRSVITVVDQRSSMFFGTRVRMKSVVAAEAASVGAWRVLGVGDRPGAIVFDDNEILSVKPHRSEATVRRILSTICKVNHRLGAHSSQPNAAMLNRALEAAARVSPHDFLIAVMTDFRGADDDTKRLFSALAQRNDVLVVFIYDPMEANLPDAGRLVFSDGGFQAEIDTGNPKLREAFSRDFEDRIELVRDVLQQHSIPVLLLDTEEDVPSQIRRQLGYVPRGGRR